MFFGLFKKKKECPIEDENFLKIKWAKDFSPKLSEVQGIIEKIDSEEVTKDWAKLDESLPYLTFLQAETLFLKLKENFIDTGKRQSISIESLNIAHRENGTPPDTEGEVFAEPFVIDENYENLLKPLVESICLNPFFDDYSYDQKRNYFLDSIYPSYLASLKCTDSVLPIFPSEEEIASGHLNIKIPFMQPRFNEDPIKKENYPNPKMEEEIPQTELPSEEAIRESNKLPEETVSDNYSPESFDTFESNSYFNTPGYFETPQDDSEDVSYKEHRDGIEQNHVVNPNFGATTTAEVKFPRFMEYSFDKDFYEPFEKEYVPWKLNQKKAALNVEIESKEQLNARVANKALNQKISNFENEELEKIRQVVLQADKRSNLKEQILLSAKRLEKEEVENRLEELDTNLNIALEEAKRRYEEAIKNINNQYNNSVKQLKAECRQKYLNDAQKDYQTKYYEETARLQNLLDNQIANLISVKLIRQSEIQEELQNIGSKIGKSLFDDGKKILKQEESRLTKEYQYARQAHLLDRQELLKNQQIEQVNAYILKIQQENEALKKAQETYENKNLKMQSDMIAAQKAALQEKELQLKTYEKNLEAKKVQAS